MRKSNCFGVFGRAFAQAVSAGTAEAHLYRHRRAALRAKLLARVIGAEIWLRLHSENSLVLNAFGMTGKNYTPKRLARLRFLFLSSDETRIPVYESNPNQV